jgi:type II secretory pathway component GspD/PulD (secretin)
VQRRTSINRPCGSSRLRLRRKLAGLVASAGLLGPHAAAQDRPQAEQATITLADRMELPRMVDLAAAELSVPIVYTQNVFGSQSRAAPTFRLPGPITESELWSLLHQALADAQLTTVRQPGSDVLHVMTFNDARNHARIANEVPESFSVGDPGFVRIRYTPSEVNASDLVARLNGLFANRRGVALQAIEIPNSRGEIIVGSPTNEARSVLMDVRRLDISGTEVANVLYTPEHVDAVTLIARANEIAAAGGQTPEVGSGRLISLSEDGRIMIVAPSDRVDTWIERLEAIDVPGSRSARLYRVNNYPAEEVASLLRSLVVAPATQRGSADSIDIRVDTITDSLTVIATPREHEQVEEIIARIESAAPNESAGFWSRQIEHREAEELLAKLRELVDAGVLEVDTGSTGGSREGRSRGLSGVSGVPATVSGNAQPPDQPASRQTAAQPRRDASGGELRLASDQQTNRVLAIGDRRMISRLDALVDELDVPLPQVQIELIVVSLNEGDSRNLAFELQALTNAGDTIVRLSSLFGIGDPGLDDPGPLAGSGFSGVVLDPGDFGVLIRALETISQGQSLSRTTLLVANGEDARIDSAVQQPFLQTTVRSSESEITGFGGSVEAGLSVSVSPQIGPANTVRLTYDVELSAFIGSSAVPELPPPTQRNTVSSISTLPDGFTVAVGGFRLTDQNEGESRVPILGSIPLLGELFKSSTESSSDARFYVFIRPKVVRERATEQLRGLSDSALRDANLPPNPPLIDLPMMW